MGRFIKGSQSEKLGEYGESLVKKTLYLRGKVTVIYTPETDRSHKFEGMALTKQDQPFFFEVKTKPSLKYYPCTGFEKNQWFYYQQFGAILPFYVYFVDSEMGGIYYATTKTLQKNIYVNQKLPKNLVLFNTSCLTLLRKLQPQELSNLKKFENKR